MIEPAQVFAGFSVGTLVGLTGVGGGSLMTPLLVLLFGVHPATAVGTDLLHAAISKAGGTYVHASKRRVEWRISVLLALGSVPAAIITLLTLRIVTGGLGSTAVITTALGIALIFTALALTARLRVQPPVDPLQPPVRPKHPAFTIAIGVVLGVLVSLSSVGAGALGVTALLFLYPKLAAQKIVASDLAHAVPLTFVAGMGHWMFGSVNWGAAVVAADRVTARHLPRQSVGGLRPGADAACRAHRHAVGDRGEDADCVSGRKHTVAIWISLSSEVIS